MTQNTGFRRTGYRIYIIKKRGHDTEYIIQLKRMYGKDGV